MCTRIFVVIVYYLFQLALLLTTQLSCNNLYCNNIEKSYREKRQILHGMSGSIHRQSVWEYFRTIFWEDSMWVVKIGLGERTVTPPLYPLAYWHVTE